jgi:ABC-type multidrug transport system ATPase subunit/predicted component of type VI protein secretion system
MPVSAAKLEIYHNQQPIQEFLLEQTPVTLGQKPDNQLILVDPNVAGYHAQISWVDQQYLITDLDSPTGTWVNHIQVLPHTPKLLTDGDVIQLGNLELHFHGIPTPEEAPDLAGTIVTGATVTQVLQVVTPQWIQEFPLKQEVLVIGRDPNCEIVIDLPVVSFHHAQLERRDGGYAIIDLGSRNGLFWQGQYISQRFLSDGDVIQIGTDLTLTYQVLPQTVMVSEQLEPLNLRGRTRLTLGRDPRNDMVIDHPIVSRFHARLDLKDGAWTITDLDSSNGTFVNGRQPTADRPLLPGDTIRIGPFHLVFQPDETLVQQNEAGNLRLDALHLIKTTPKGVVLLDDVSLAILPREFVAIVGVSGAGKSTLLDALNGLRPASSGVVLVNNNDLYKNFNAYRTELGYVPQDDIIHRELTVWQALDYAAQLRLPADTTLAERRERVQTVLADLELTHRQHVPVKQLSGGQRKRVSMGVELLTQPSLFFLDEATSGLDPGTEVQMMRLLRKLADQGRTVLLITHATKNVMMCDMVVFLTKGGRVAYFGPPDQALTYFGVSDFDEIYLRVEGELSPEDWQRRYLQSQQYQQYVQERQHDLQAPSSAQQARPAHQSPTKAKGISAWRQLAILSRRNLTILTQDRPSLLLMLALAPILGLLDLAMWKRTLFDRDTGDAGQAITMLFVAVLIATMVGSLGTMREIVKEAEIYRRERMVGLKLLPYILSKIWFAIVLAIYQAAIFLLTKWLSVAIPGDATTILSMYITLLLATVGGMVMGLLVSALSVNQNAAPLLTILFLVPQITFAGAILPLRDVGFAGQVLSQLTVTRWAFESMMTITGIGRDVSRDSCWKKPEAERKTLTDADKQACICLGANIFKQCNFPGILDKYDEAVDATEPVKPQDPGDPPTLPEYPDSIYQDEIKAYNEKVKAYKNKIETWQQEFGDWKGKRETAIAASEAIIGRFERNQGVAFAVNVPAHWGKLGLLILGMLGALLVVQKRKDTL